MACRAAWQGPLNCFQMVFKQNAAIVGDAGEYCKDAQCGYQRVDKLKSRLIDEQTIRPI